MIRRHLLNPAGFCAGLLAIAWLSPCQVLADIGPEHIWTGDPSPCIARPGDSDEVAWLACLRQQGAPIKALQFALEVHRSSDEWAFLTEFHERGRVDVGEVFLPFKANTNDQVILLNTDRLVTWPGSLVSFDPPGDAGTQQVLRLFPGAFASGRLGVASHRQLSDGRQRFVITDVLTNECRACDIVGTAITFVDFLQGQPVGVYPVGWALPDRRSDPGAAISAILNGDVRELQVALDLAGYYSGPVDGTPGQYTQSATAEFRAEICSYQAGPLDYKEVLQLGRAGVAAEPKPCSPAMVVPPPATTRHTRDQIEAAAIEILLGDPYGRTRAEVRANIIGIVFGIEPVCGNAQDWVVRVRTAPSAAHGVIEGYMVISDINARPTCIGLPFLD